MIIENVAGTAGTIYVLIKHFFFAVLGCLWYFAAAKEEGNRDFEPQMAQTYLEKVGKDQKK